MKRKAKMEIFGWLCLTVLIGIIAFLTVDFWAKTGINVLTENVSRDLFAETMRIEMLVCIPLTIVTAVAAYYFQIEAMFEKD